MRYTTSIMVLLAVLGTAGCGMGTGLNEWGGYKLLSPRPFMQNLPEGHDDYSRGFRAGCSSFTRTVGSGLLRMYDSDMYDPEEGIENNEYYAGYRIGSYYCTQYLDVEPI